MPSIAEVGNRSPDDSTPFGYDASGLVSRYNPARHQKRVRRIYDIDIVQSTHAEGGLEGIQVEAIPNYFRYLCEYVFWCEFCL